ncbi:MAG: TonB-dependent receptor [Flavobacteriaceae bacterium]|nr:TonB-dependent receptor [Flavobacteriaceae bacterium]
MKNRLYLLTYFPFLWTTFSSAQQVLNGAVYDASTSEPLVGATVLVQNSGSGTITDTEGSFSLEHGGAYPVVVEVSYLGYEAQTFRLAAPQLLEIYLTPSSTSLNEIIVTSRRRSEAVQEVPIPIAVIGAREIDNSVSFNVNRVKELVPSVQLYSSNPRNTTLNIRGLGSTFGLTNDGIDPGVGFYVDGVYYARPAATTLPSRSRCSGGHRVPFSERTRLPGPSTSPLGGRPLPIPSISRNPSATMALCRPKGPFREHW